MSYFSRKSVFCDVQHFQFLEHLFQMSCNMTTVMLAGMMNVNIAGKVGITRSAIWRLSKRREVKGEDVAVKGDWGKGGRKVVIKEPEAKWLKMAK